MKFLSLVGIGVCSALRLTAADSQTWTLLPEASHVDFAVHATVDSFVGHLAKFETQFVSDTNDQVSTATMTFQVADLKTGKEDRDTQMLEWLDAKKYPAATFVLQNLALAGTQLQATGDFTLHGVTHSIRFPVTLGRSGTRHTIDGVVTIDHRDWDLKIIRKLGLLKVDPIIKVTFHFEAAAP